MHRKIILFACFVLFGAGFMYGQQIDSILSAVNHKYSTSSIYGYSVKSNHWSFFSDTVTYSYVTRVVVDSSGSHNYLKRFFCETQIGLPLFGFWDGKLLSFDASRSAIVSSKLDSPYWGIRQGAVRWAVFSPFIVRDSLFDWGSYSSRTIRDTILGSGNAIVLELAKEYLTNNFVFGDTPAITERNIRLCVGLMDSLIYSVEESVCIGGFVDRTIYSFSEYKFGASSAIDSVFNRFHKSFELGWIEVNHADRIMSLRERRLLLTEQDMQSLELSDFTGETTLLGSIKARYLIIEFWFIGCQPCVEASRALSKLARIKPVSGLEIIGVNMFDKDFVRMKDYLDRVQPVYRQFYLKDQRSRGLFMGYGMPLTLFYDRMERRVLGVLEGFDEDIYDSKVRRWLESVDSRE